MRINDAGNNHLPAKIKDGCATTYEVGRVIAHVDELPFVYSNGGHLLVVRSANVEISIDKDRIGRTVILGAPTADQRRKQQQQCSAL